MEATHGFVATLSDGTVAAEHQDNWAILPGERKPWVRLAQHLAQEGLHVTSLRYNANGQTYHAPKLDTRFEKGGRAPDHYAIEYILEREESPGSVVERLFVDIGAYYGNASVHMLIELGGQQSVWTQLRNGYAAMQKAPAAPTR